MSLHYSCNGANGTVLLWEGNNVVADLSKEGDAYFVDQVALAKEITTAVNLARDERDLCHCFGCQGRFAAEDLYQGRCQMCVETWTQ